MKWWKRSQKILLIASNRILVTKTINICLPSFCFPPPLLSLGAEGMGQVTNDEIDSTLTCNPPPPHPLFRCKAKSGWNLRSLFSGACVRARIAKNHQFKQGLSCLWNSLHPVSGSDRKSGRPVGQAPKGVQEARQGIWKEKHEWSEESRWFYSLSFSLFPLLRQLAVCRSATVPTRGGGGGGIGDYW